jgi:AraC-like DNA-binding protein
VIVPYLRTKKAVAEMLAEYCASRSANMGGSTERQREIVAWFGRTAPEGHGNALLSDQEVRAARREYDQGKATISELAQRCGLSQTAMFHIVHRHSYRHVQDEEDAS